VAFHDVRFPTGISYGSRGGPGFKTEIIELDSGQERRLSRWSQPRHRYSIGYGIKDYSDLAALKAFYLARIGAANSFRFKDFQDFTSADIPVQVNSGGTLPAFTDQLIGIGDGFTKVFQLVKRYQSGPTVLVRTITKPITTTITVGLNGVQQALGSFVVDAASGRVSFISAPAAGVQITWGGEFDTHVRFANSADDLLSMSFDTFDYGSSALECVEVLDSSALSGEAYFGGARAVTDLDVILSESLGRVVSLLGLTADRKAFLPEISAQTPPGGPWFYVENEATNAFNVLLRTSDDIAVRTIVPGEVVTVLLARTSATTLAWLVV